MRKQGRRFVTLLCGLLLGGAVAVLWQPKAASARGLLGKAQVRCSSRRGGHSRHLRADMAIGENLPDGYRDLLGGV